VTIDGAISAGIERWEGVHDGQRVLFGPTCSSLLGEEARALGARRVFLVTDRGLVAAGHAGQAEASLRAAGLQVVVWDGVRENPTSAGISEAAEAAREFGPDLLVGLGGGSSMDVAKGVNFLVAGGGRMEDYHGRDKARGNPLPSIGVPTTTGTGSEAQAYALVCRDEDGVKIACGDERVRFRRVLLDPKLTLSMPPEVAALSAMDAASHAVESYVTTTGTPISRALAREAWRMIDEGFEAALQAPASEAARGRMLVGAYLAGCAIEMSMLGAAHACANPLTTRLGIHHGEAVALMLPAVVRYNAATQFERYNVFQAGSASRSRGIDLADRIEQMRAAAGLHDRLRDVGVERQMLETLARDAADQWTGKHNPVPVTETELHRLYEEAW
jgi:alcohol dehydrogenase